jgi:hypothetical protein
VLGRAEKFTHITRRALRQFVTDQLNERLKAALGGRQPRYGRHACAGSCA